MGKQSEVGGHRQTIETGQLYNTVDVIQIKLEERLREKGHGAMVVPARNPRGVRLVGE